MEPCSLAVDYPADMVPVVVQMPTMLGDREGIIRVHESVGANRASGRPKRYKRHPGQR